MSNVHLRFATDILKRFGEELNPNPDQGILELIKNAYDADALNCTIELTSVNEPGGTIRISDDGDGMSSKDVVEGWLVLGRSAKNVAQTTTLGRIPAGSKGLGRLAALRMGSMASLITRPVDKPREYSIEIDWTRFDKAKVVEDVTLKLVSRKRAPDAEKGTLITLSRLHSALSLGDVKRLARGILLLADPFGDNPIGFNPALKAPEFEELEKLVQKRYFKDAEFHLRAEIDEYGIAHAVVSDYKGEELYRAEHNDLVRKTPNPPYGCPRASFDLWVFILDGKTFSARSVTKDEVQKWLREFGGTHLYINGIRVSPYGNPGNDWLDMNLRRAQHPELRPSTNTSIGRVVVTDLENRLPQKTDRSGLVENDSFNELKRFAKDALDWMGRERLREREAKRTDDRASAPRNVDEAKEAVETAIKDLPSKAQMSVQAPFKHYHQVREKEASSLRKEVQLYRTLSTAGITAAVFAHETRQPLRVINSDTRMLERRLRSNLGAQYETLASSQINRILRQAETLEAYSSLTLSFTDHEKRRIARVDVHKVMRNAILMFEPIFHERRVTVSTLFAQAHPYFRGSEAAVESIVTNLVVNSLRAFEDASPRDRLIEIKTAIDDAETGKSNRKRLIIFVADNGPGIKDIKVRDIWLPGESTYPNGTGLGLTIVRDTVADLGGRADAVAKGSLGGAEIIIDLPILGA